jgi:glycosyltransferase involved in cell wall biosynthesis
MSSAELRVLVLMLQSIRPNSNHGGSSKIVKEVCAGLAEAGHQVHLLCGSTQDNQTPFHLSPRVQVSPTLPFRQSWQDTWLVPPADLQRIITTVSRVALDADRILLFDSHFLYPDVFPRDTPTIWSLRDFVYVQALQGSMAFRRDQLIAPSGFIRDAYCDAMGGWLPGIEDRVVTIPNGVNLRHFRPTTGRRMRDELGLTDEPVLLFPHRPEDAKGLGVSLEVCARLLEKGWSQIRLLILRGTDVNIMPEVRDFYVSLERRVEEMGLRGHVMFHAWVPPTRMPEVYAAASVTLCLGDIVEACSNSALESIACGVPVVASNVACYREFPSNIHKVSVGDVEAAVQVVDDLLAGRQRLDRDVARAELARNYGHERMIVGFRHLIEQASVLAPLVPAAPSGSRLKVPAWISPQRGALYDEYAKVFTTSSLLEEIWRAHGHGSFEARSHGENADLEHLSRSGWLVSVA